MVSCLSSTMSSIGWYIGELRHMSYDKPLFNILQKQEGGMSLELGDDYPLRGFGSISFQMSSSDSLYLNDILFVRGFKEKKYFNLLYGRSSRENCT